MEKVIKKILPIICLVPLVIGYIGYIVAGKNVSDSLYGSITLYSMSMTFDSHNGYIELARWTAPLVSATLILSIISKIWNSLVWKIKCFSKDSVAVYSDTDIDISFEKGTKAIYPGNELKTAARSHILLFSSDLKNFDFYAKNKDRLKDKAVFLGLRELESGLIKESGNITIFDVNNSIARVLWKKIRVWELNKKELDIVIYGDSILAQHILSCALQLNLFSTDQKITYHIISKSGNFFIKHSDFRTFNNDQLVHYTSLNESAWEVIKKADIVISADKVTAEMVQELALNAHYGKVYYYYDSSSLSQYFDLDNIECFGADSEIYTDDNIRKQKLIETAKKLNEEYAVNYSGKTDWNELSGFLKNSNISSADFNEVITELSDRLNSEKLAELEHIRWCRFHYLNYWKQGVPDNGKIKDSKKRIHKNLMPYAELSEDDKNKCRNIVYMAIKRKNGLRP